MFGLTTELITNGKVIRVLTFRALALRQSEWWPIYLDTDQTFVSIPRRRSTAVSLETNPLILSLKLNFFTNNFTKYFCIQLESHTVFLSIEALHPNQIPFSLCILDPNCGVLNNFLRDKSSYNGP